MHTAYDSNPDSRLRTRFTIICPSTTDSKIHDRGTEEYRFARMEAVMEYTSLSPLPPPFNAIKPFVDLVNAIKPNACVQLRTEAAGLVREQSALDKGPRRAASARWFTAAKMLSRISYNRLPYELLDDNLGKRVSQKQSLEHEKQLLLDYLEKADERRTNSTEVR